MRYLSFDPGESTGWAVYDTVEQKYYGGTIGKNLVEIADKIIEVNPDTVVYESFALYPGKAKSMSWNSFYPVEVIGVIKYICFINGIHCMRQQPSIKKYSGPLPTEVEGKQTKHTKDAMMHMQYFLRNNKGEH